MFDDQQQSGSPVPGNLPVGEPEDMFAGTDPAPAPPEQTPSQELPPIPTSGAQPSTTPEAPPAPVPSALSSGALRPAQAATPPPAQQPPSAPPPTNMHVPPEEELGHEVVKGPSSAKFIMTIIIVIIGVGVLGGIGYMAYRIFAGSEEPATVPQTTFATVPNANEQTIPDTAQSEDNTSPTATDAADIIDDSVLFGEPIDNDSDNLDNAREEVLGTDPENWDTDGDGLGDGDEVIIWKTDPLEPDTDKDGYEDGSEVRNGYSPTGPGRIFEPPTPGQQPASATTDTSESATMEDASDTAMTSENTMNSGLCESDAECFVVAAASCAPSSFKSIATFDLRQSFGVLQDITYSFEINGESSNGSCNVDMSIERIDLAFTDDVTENQKQQQRDASAVREGKSMNCQITSDALIEAINMRNEVDMLTRIRQTGSCLGPLADESA